MSALKRSPSVRTTLSARSRPSIAATPTPRRKRAPKAACSFKKKSDMIGETARPIGRAISTTVASAPRLAAVAAISSPMNPAPMMTTLGFDAETLADRGRVGDVAQREHARQIDARNIEPPLPRAGREDEMSVSNRAAVAELHLLRSAVDPRRADAEPQVDALLAEMRVGPERQPVDFHFALEKRLGQRRALIGQILLGGEKNDLAVKPLLAQGRRGLNPGVAGADDDDRGQRHAQDAEEALWIGPHPTTSS